MGAIDASLANGIEGSEDQIAGDKLQQCAAFATVLYSPSEIRVATVDEDRGQVNLPPHGSRYVLRIHDPHHPSKDQSFPLCESCDAEALRGLALPNALSKQLASYRIVPMTSWSDAAVDLDFDDSSDKLRYRSPHLIVRRGGAFVPLGDIPIEVPDVESAVPEAAAHVEAGNVLVVRATTTSAGHDTSSAVVLQIRRDYVFPLPHVAP
ncbi:MAG: hypothetical protein U0414_02710 [Polyangiaceae bacterium]